MEIIISDHAKQRMKERKISDQQVFVAILQPDKVEKDKTCNTRFVAKKVYYSSLTKNRQLLLVFYEMSGGRMKILTVVTVISTSKIFKYF